MITLIYITSYLSLSEPILYLNRFLQNIVDNLKAEYLLNISVHYKQLAVSVATVSQSQVLMSAGCQIRDQNISPGHSQARYLLFSSMLNININSKLKWNEMVKTGTKTRSRSWPWSGIITAKSTENHVLEYDWIMLLYSPISSMSIMKRYRYYLRPLYIVTITAQYTSY